MIGEGEIMAAAFKKTTTKSLPAGGQDYRSESEWFHKADVLAEYLGLELIKRKAR